MLTPTATLKHDISITFPDIHKTRLDTFFTFVEAGCCTQNVTVTSLGRALKRASGTDVKHDVKHAGRLIGNTYLHHERICFYQLMSERLRGDQKHPFILVDWSPINGLISFSNTSFEAQVTTKSSAYPIKLASCSFLKSGRLNTLFET